MDTPVNGWGQSLRENPPMATRGFLERLHAAAKLQGVFTPAQFADKLKVGRQIGHKWWTGGTQKISAEDLFLISDTLKIRARWLLDGSEPMRMSDSPTPDEKRALDLYRAFRAEHSKWREDWLSHGHQILQNLTQPPSVAHPFPKRK